MNTKHMKYVSIKNIIITVLFIILCRVAFASDFEKTKWVVFFYLKPNSVPMPTTFIITRQNGTELQGTFGTPGYEQKFFEKGTINQTKDGFEFKIVVPSPECNGLIYSGKISLVSENYLPKDEYIKKAFNIIKSEKNNKIHYRVADSIAYCEKGFPSFNVKSFENGSGFIFFPR